MIAGWPVIETVAGFLERHPVPLVVDPVLIASSGARLLEEDAVETLVARLFPLATVVTPNLAEARSLSSGPARSASLPSGCTSSVRRRRSSPEGTGEPVDHLFDGTRHVEIRVARHEVAATHGAGCTHSATLAALLARGESLEDAARGAARLASRAVAQGHPELGAGEGPVDVLGLKGAA